ncbi:hypothetical protein D3C81_1159500 [compost metagenome]
MDILLIVDADMLMQRIQGNYLVLHGCYLADHIHTQVQLFTFRDVDQLISLAVYTFSRNTQTTDV